MKDLSSFGEIIYNHYKFDAFKLLERSVLYGRRNAERLRKMLENIFKNQPYYLSDLQYVVSTILEVIYHCRGSIFIFWATFFLC